MATDSVLLATCAFQPSPSAPTPSPSTYELVGGPFKGPNGSLLGSGVSMYGGLAVAGLPGSAPGLPGNSPGSVFTFQQSSAGTSRRLRRGLEETQTTSWTQGTQALQGQEPRDMFGWSLSLYNNGMVVGAPGTVANGTNVATGAAYYYELSADSSSWNQVGSVIRGEEDIFAVDEYFGSSVAQGGIYRVVVGAGNRNNGDGAIYTFSLDETTMVWSRIATTGLISNNSTGERLGSTVSMSYDGGRMIAGAPGANDYSGRVLSYQWKTDTSEWTQVAEFPGDPSESFGSCTVCLSVSCDTFAVGGPGASSWSGVIRVYKLVEGSVEFRQFGPDILGSEGENLGSAGSITGSVNGQLVVILAGTTDGRVHRYESSGGDWLKTTGAIDTGLSEPITALSTDAQSANVIVGSVFAESVAVYSMASDVDVTPTTTPISAPTPSSPSPSAAPPPSSWSLSTTFPASQGSNLGVSVALVSLLMAAGATSGSGYVNVYQRAGSGWTFQAAINGTEQSSRFSEAIDFNPSDGGLLVGAPGTLAEGTSTSQGAAYYYSFTSSSWAQRGGVIRGDTDVYAANEDFGYSVAVSGNEDLAIGAPRSSVENIIERGRVYTFAFDASSASWARKGSGSTTLGEAGSDFYGSSVDVSADGSTLVVGAPGHSSGAGAIYIYSWSGSDWVLVSKFTGEASESFGDSVVVLSTTDGSVVAGGGMRSSGGSGVIRVYQLQSGTYAPMGSPIVGAAGDGLGSAKSLAGSTDGILAGTLSGDVKSFAYNPGTGTWDQSSAAVATGASAGLAISGSSTLGSFVAGTSGDVQIYGLAES
jgi:FG-GAP repeat